MEISFQIAKEELFAAFRREDLGNWLKKPIEQDEFALPEWLHSQEDLSETKNCFETSEKMILPKFRQQQIWKNEKTHSLKSYSNKSINILLLEDAIEKSHDINHNYLLQQKLTYYSYNNYVINFDNFFGELMMKPIIDIRIRVYLYLKPKLTVSNTVFVLLFIGIFLE